MKQRKGLLALVGNTLVHHPARIPEGLIVLLIPLLLWLVGARVGGDLDRGDGLALAVPLVYVLCGLWAIWWTLKNQGVELSKGVLWTLPLVAYLGFHSLFFASAPWRSEPFFGMIFMAWLLYAIVAHTVRHRFLLQTLTALTLAAVLLLGLYVVFLGLPDLRGEQASLVPLKIDAAQAAFGVFEQAPPMVFGWLLTLPLALVGMALPRLPGYLRITLGGYLLVGFYQVGVAGNSAGYLAALVVLLIAPFFLRPSWRGRLRVFGVILGMAVLVAAFYIIGTGFREKVKAARTPQPDLVETSRWSAAWDVWKGDAVLGVGLGTLPLKAEGVAVEPSGTDALGTRQTSLQWLAETGLIGCVLGALAVWGVLGRLALAWIREPFFPKDKEAEFRHSKGHGESSRPSRSSRRRREHRLKRSTTAKVVFGGVLLGMFGCLVFAQFESSWLKGMPLLLLGVMAGIAERLVGESGQTIRLSTGRSPLRFGGAVVACVLAGFSLLFVDGYRANADVFAGMQALEPYDKEPRLAFESPAGVMEARRKAQYAIEAMPEHADAWALTARTYLFEEAIARLPLKEAGRKAVYAAQKAVDIFPESSAYNLLLAQGLALEGTDPKTVQATFSRAAELAPRNPEVLFQWARFRYFESNDPAGARQLLEQVFRLAPNHAGALELSRRVNL